MRLENSFEVPASVQRVWPFLLDVERIVPCMPGAELTEAVDDQTWKGRVKIKVGPVALQFRGSVTIVERDDANYSVVLTAKGMEQRGRGAASATITSTLEAIDESNTRVLIVQDLEIQGQAAQISRGMLPDVTSNLTDQFAQCIRSNIVQLKDGSQHTSPRTEAEREIKIVSLGAKAIWATFKRFFRRLFRREKSSS